MADLQKIIDERRATQRLYQRMMLQMQPKMRLVRKRQNKRVK